MKQTAVEWLVEQICTDVEMHDEYGNVSHIEFWNAFRSCTDLSKYIEQAKQMEKEQIMDSFNTGKFELDGFIDWEQYYNETYKNTDE